MSVANAQLALVQRALYQSALAALAERIAVSLEEKNFLSESRTVVIKTIVCVLSQIGDDTHIPTATATAPATATATAPATATATATATKDEKSLSSPVILSDIQIPTTDFPGLKGPFPGTYAKGGSVKGAKTSSTLEEAFKNLMNTKNGVAILLKPNGKYYIRAGHQDVRKNRTNVDRDGNPTPGFVYNFNTKDTTWVREEAIKYREEHGPFTKDNPFCADKSVKEKTKSVPEVEPETESVPEPKTDAVSAAEPETEVEPDTEPEVEPETKYVPEPEPETESVPAPEPETEVVPEPEPETEVVPAPEVEPETEVVPESKTVSIPEPETEPETEVGEIPVTITDIARPIGATSSSDDESDSSNDESDSSNDESDSSDDESDSSDDESDSSDDESDSSDDDSDSDDDNSDSDSSDNDSDSGDESQKANAKIILIDGKKTRYWELRGYMFSRKDGQPATPEGYLGMIRCGEEIKYVKELPQEIRKLF
jgi:hypothetical protein